MINFPKQKVIPVPPLKQNMEDVLIIGFDRHVGESDMLVVFRQEGDVRKIVNVYKDFDADEIYRQLTRKDI